MCVRTVEPREGERKRLFCTCCQLVLTRVYVCVCVLLNPLRDLKLARKSKL